MSDNVHEVFKPLLDSIRARRVLIADGSVVRAALMDVIDTDDPEGGVLTGWMGLWHPFESVADETRGRFADAVIKRIKELQSPMFNLGVKLENLCERHKAARLPAPTADFCSDCENETRAKLGG